jgi:hypothetical protein
MISKQPDWRTTTSKNLEDAQGCFVERHAHWWKSCTMMKWKEMGK